MIQQITISVTIPDGYEATGEYRRPVMGDFFIPTGVDNGPWFADCESDCAGKKIILRKKWAFPEWFPKGWWLRKSLCGQWWVTAINFTEKHVASAETMWAFHGETFTPPSVQSIQKV